MVLDASRPSLRGPGLNPAQQQVLDLLRVPVDERPSFDAELRHWLRARLEEGLAPVVAGLPDDEQLWIDKYRLAQVLGCEAKYLAEDDAPFAWTLPLARGTVVHKAIELSVHWRGEPTPLALVDEALSRLEHGDQAVTDFLQTCSEADLAELAAAANDAVAKFLESFPPLRSGWRPVVEGRLRADLCDGRIVLRGKPDLTLGGPDGTTAGKVVIDLKTGGFAPQHAPDLRFYALLETLRIGTPPMLLASYYLDAGEPRHERVTEDLLLATVARVVDAAHRMVALRHHHHPPRRRPGPSCRWCPVLDGCDEGRSHLDQDAGAHLLDDSPSA